MRGSIITDVAQAILFAVLLVGVLVWIVPQDSPVDYVTSGAWSLEGGVDFIIGAGLQCLSYGFHDAVLTDRGFICEEKKMLRSFVVAGLLGFLAIVLFSLIGVHAYLNDMSTAGSSAPVVVAQSLGIVAFFMMAVIMIATAGSTLDSTFSSLAKLAARDLPGILGKTPSMNPRIIGIVFMIVFGIVGNLPMIMGADIIAATTISGTMIMGLGPVFLMHGVVKPTKVALPAGVLDRHGPGHRGHGGSGCARVHGHRRRLVRELPRREPVGRHRLLGCLPRAGPRGPGSR